MAKHPHMPSPAPPRPIVTFWSSSMILQDAHEFFNFVLNEMADSLVARKKQKEAHAHDNDTWLQQPVPAVPTLQQQQQRLSSWSKMSSRKGNSGNGTKNGSTSYGRANATATPHRRGPRLGPDSPSKWGESEGIGRVPPSGLATNGSTGGHVNSDGVGGVGRNGDGSAETWVHRIFQGVLTNQTKCLCCETVGDGFPLSLVFE